MSSSGAKTGSGTVSDITTSGQPLLTITNPAGPTTDLAVGAYAPGTAVESYIAANVPIAAGTAVNVASVALAAGTWLIAARAIVQDTAAALAEATIWIGPNSASSTGAYASSTSVGGDLAGGDELLPLVIVKTVVLAAATTVYLGCQAQAAMTVLVADTYLTIGNCSGITAVRIA